MPLPLLFIGAAAATGLFGAGKAIKAASDNSKANAINKQAEELVETSKQTLETAKKASGKSLETLGEKKVDMLDTGLRRFVDLFELLHNVDFQDSVGLDELGKFRIDRQALKELREMGDFAASVAGGATSGAIAGAMTAFGAYGAATTFAAASTGTFISTLSGAAATNATLAFFGGGSLAAGGLGVAGGTAVLGGLIAGPALAVMGLVMGAKASANLERARSNRAEARKIHEELKTAAMMCNAIRRRAYMFQRLLIRCDAVFTPLVFALEEAIKTSGTDYQHFSDAQKRTVGMAASMAGTIKSILDTPILTKEGELTEESETRAKEIGSLKILEQHKTA